MRRGEIWTVSHASYAGKPRPAVVIQSDAFGATRSVTICPFTTDETEAPLLRLLVQPSEINGLRSASRLMVDKVVTIPRERVRSHVGRLDEDDQRRLDRAIMVFLGLV